MGPPPRKANPFPIKSAQIGDFFRSSRSPTPKSGLQSEIRTRAIRSPPVPRYAFQLPVPRAFPTRRSATTLDGSGFHRTTGPSSNFVLDAPDGAIFVKPSDLRRGALDAAAAELGGGNPRDPGEAAVELGERLIAHVERDFRNPHLGAQQLALRPVDPAAVDVVG